jgi:hypothetical protein
MDGGRRQSERIPNVRPGGPIHAGDAYGGRFPALEPEARPLHGMEFPQRTDRQAPGPS